MSSKPSANEPQKLYGIPFTAPTEEPAPPKPVKFLSNNE